MHVQTDTHVQPLVEDNRESSYLLFCFLFFFFERCQQEKWYLKTISSLLYKLGLNLLSYNQFIITSEDTFNITKSTQ